MASGMNPCRNSDALDGTWPCSGMTCTDKVERSKNAFLPTCTRNQLCAKHRAWGGEQDRDEVTKASVTSKSPQVLESPQG